MRAGSVAPRIAHIAEALTKACDEYDRSAFGSVDRMMATARLVGVCRGLVEFCDAPHWSADPDNVADLIAWLDERCEMATDRVEHVLELLRAPWKWDREYTQMRESGGGSERLATEPCSPPEGRS